MTNQTAILLAALSLAVAMVCYGMGHSVLTVVAVWIGFVLAIWSERRKLAALTPAGWMAARAEGKWRFAFRYMFWLVGLGLVLRISDYLLFHRVFRNMTDDLFFDFVIGFLCGLAIWKVGEKKFLSGL
jgi:hypothetical protein